MSKEKQIIEEMAHLICEMALKPNNCRECGGRKGGCFTIPKMEALYNAGYRKQSEGENITENNPVDEFICSECGFIMRDCCRYEIDEDDGDEACYEFAFKYCPRCGAKMKGGGRAY